MELNYKTILLINCSIGIIVAVFCASAFFLRPQNDCADTENEPGKFADPSLKSVTVVRKYNVLIINYFLIDFLDSSGP